MSYNPHQSAEKYRLALEQAAKDKPQAGLYGFEQEWNLLDPELRPLLTVGTGPRPKSFVDYLRASCIPEWMLQFSQLEVFHWMIEWATRPYYSPRGAVYEARLMEAALINALHAAGAHFGERLHYWHGNLLVLTDIGHQSIPGEWGIAKRRYLEKCVDLYGDTLATAGIHTNLSLPDPLFAWDFMQLSPSDRGDMHLDEFKSEFYITATRLMRAFAALFIATAASTPMQAQVRDGRAIVVLTENDSRRNLTFPNPAAIDLPDLYRSYRDYLQISYDLVRRGVRFGNNNWTPVRARSFADPVERIISTTSDELAALYERGLFAAGQAPPPEELAVQIEKQNLMARINLPMGRVEVRVDDGGHSLELDVANLTLKHLLLLRIYSDAGFGRGFRYDREDIDRARANELLAAKLGMRAQIENPLSGKPITMRAFLAWAVEELRPLAQELGLWDDLLPLVEISQGARNTAERFRARLQGQLANGDEVPLDALKELLFEREAQVRSDVERIAAECGALGADSAGLLEFLQHGREAAHENPATPIQYRARAQEYFTASHEDITSEVLDLAQQLIRIPSVTAGGAERIEEVHRAAALIEDYLLQAGLDVRYLDGKYPAIHATFSGGRSSQILLCGHYDVVQPEPDDAQFDPRVDGEYLIGRGAADMKTVVATYLVWMKHALRAGATANGAISLLLVGNEENGESERWGTPFVLKELGLDPRLLIAGERTGESGDELMGEICVQNRGVMRAEFVMRGSKGHSGVAGARDLSERMLTVRAELINLFEAHLTLSAADGWQSQAQFPFMEIGRRGVYNISASEGVLGLEIRSIPQDDLAALRREIESYCSAHEIEAAVAVAQNGIACDENNPALKMLIEAVQAAGSGGAVRLGKKLAGTSARFAPRGQGVVWGQSGLDPHGRGERHYIPSIEPYYQALNRLAERAT